MDNTLNLPSTVELEARAVGSPANTSFLAKIEPRVRVALVAGSFAGEGNFGPLRDLLARCDWDVVRDVSHSEEGLANNVVGLRAILFRNQQ